MSMTKENALKQGERGLKERIEHKGDDRTTDEKLFEELFAKTYQLGNLVAHYHTEVDRILAKERDTIRKLKASLARMRETIQ